ncbi:MAG TPA: hypothetical protein VEP90_14105 [Methylomirabilota bacterium]|nr:hypothetical protein [Methylomirabilota bacterium]
MVSPLQFTGQSNAPLQLPEVTVSPGASGSNFSAFQSGTGTPPPSPDHISGAASSIGAWLQYPLDTPKYYMTFDIKEYSRHDLLTIGTLFPWGNGPNFIVMPLSEGLNDTLEARWEPKPIPWIVGGAVDAFMGLGALADQGNEAAKQRIADVRKNIKGGLGQLGTSLPIGGDTISTLAGVAPNQFLTILYIGPEYKQYSFQWNISPRNAQESEQIRKICNTFKKAMSPTLEFGILWGYPCIFKIMFQPNASQLYKFRPAILKRFSVNYTPLGTTSFYGAGQNAPEGMTIQATFVELEYWTQGEHGERMTATPDNSSNPDR